MADPQTNLSDDSRVLGDDPLAKLHKMSTTAGLGSGDYVAINLPAVVAAFLGLAGVLAKLSNILLLIPVLGVVCGIVALRQIAGSNGTQTGKGVALIGLVVSLLVSVWVIVPQVIDYSRTQTEQVEIAALVQSLGVHIKADELDQAYALFDANFRDLIPLDRFKARCGYFKSPQVVAVLGDFVSIEWNGRLIFETDTKTDSPVASGVALVNFAKQTEPTRQDIFFHKVGAKWKISAIPTVFPFPKATEPSSQ